MRNTKVECRKIKAHEAHRFLLREGGQMVSHECEGRPYALLLANAVLLDFDSVYNVDWGAGQLCRCHGLVWDYRDVSEGFCPFGSNWKDA